MAVPGSLCIFFLSERLLVLFLLFQNPGPARSDLSAREAAIRDRTLLYPKRTTFMQLKLEITAGANKVESSVVTFESNLKLA